MWPVFVITMVSLLPFPDRCVVGDDPVSMPIADFRALPRERQAAVVVAAIQHRLERTLNLRYDLEVFFFTHRGEDAGPYSPRPQDNLQRYRFWWLDGSYRMERDDYFGGILKDRPDECVTNAFDAAQGVNRGLVNAASLRNTYARIDVKQDELVVTRNRYSFWFDGRRSHAGEHFLRYILDHGDALTVDASDHGEATIVVTLPWAHNWDGQIDGEHRLHLDPLRGFMPVRTFARWEDATHDWRSNAWHVLESRLVGEVWMPTRLQEVRRGSRLDPGTASCYQITVSSIEQGRVVPEDLYLEFPRGTEVVDAIRGVGYVVGPHGEETQLEPLIGASAVIEANWLEEQDERASSWFSLWTLNVVVAFGALVIWLYRRARSARK
jgi:hypothetical protein